MKIYNLGSLNIDYVYTVDHFVQAGETLASAKMEVFPGGKGLNQSVALARAGVKVLHGALLGQDGALLQNILHGAGVDVSRIQAMNSTCGHAIIQVDRKGQNCILLFGGTNALVDKNYIKTFLQDAEAGDILVLQNEVSGLKDAFEIAHQKGMQIAFNPSPFQQSILKLPLNYVKWWFCNEIEAAALFGSGDPQKIAAQFKAKYPESGLILTLGQEGSMYMDATTCLTQKAYPVHAVDTTAAGDTFTGYFLAALLHGQTKAQA